MINLKHLETEKLGDLCLKITDGAHHSPSSVNNGMPMASVKDLTDFGINLESCRKISKDDYDKLVKGNCKPEKGDVLIAKDGNSALETVCEVKEEIDVVLLSSVAILRPNPEKIIPSYLKYYLSSPNIYSYLKNGFTTGAAIPRVILKDFKRAEILLPDLITQQKIASILSAFDDLIENNTRRITILEEMARLIYREWFVHYRYPGHENDLLVDSGTELGGIPLGWEVRKLEEIADINPENISTDYEGEIEYINISGVDTGKISETEMYDFEDAPGRAKRKVKHGDIIWSSVRPNLKSYALILNPKSNWIASTGFAVIRPSKLPSSFLYNFTTMDFFVEYLINHARGSAYPAVNVSDFNDAKIIIPSTELVNRFDEIVWPNYQQIDKLERKNKKLKQTRDLLLPKLISGKVEVNEINNN